MTAAVDEVDLEKPKVTSISQMLSQSCATSTARDS